MSAGGVYCRRGARQKCLCSVAVAVLALGTPQLIPSTSLLLSFPIRGLDEVVFEMILLITFLTSEINEQNYSGMFLFTWGRDSLLEQSHRFP